jgi:integrase
MASIDRRANGRWRARWREYPGGPQRAKHFDRKLDAERFLVAIQHRLMTGAYITPEAARVTFDAYSREYVERQPWRASSTQVAEFGLGHARRAFGKRPLGTIRKSDVQGFVTGLHLSPTTVGVVFQHVSAVFEAAVQDRLITFNPAKGVKLPKRDGGEIVPPTMEEVAAIYEAATNWFRPAVVLGAGLGLRQAEASGLTGDRIDWLGRAVRIDRQWVTRMRPAHFGPPKTASSVRTVPASDWVIRELSGHVGRRHEGFVVHRDGEPVDSNAFSYQWRRATRRAGVTGVRYHDLRHGFASMLIAAGCSVKAVQRAVGHASSTTTLNLYVHLWPGDEDRIRQAVDQAVALVASEDSLRTEGRSR